MEFKDVIARLFVIVAKSDNEISPKEVSIGSTMLRKSGMSEPDLTMLMHTLPTTVVTEKFYQDTVNHLKKLERSKQIECMAWMCVIANADGWMHPNEWQLIYKLYHKELHLETGTVISRQKEISSTLHEVAFKHGVIVNC